MNKSNNTDTGKRISFLRKKVFRMSQSEFASTLGISQPYLAQLESGKRQLSDENKNRFADILKLDPGFFDPEAVTDTQINDFLFPDNSLSDDDIGKILSELKDLHNPVLSQKDKEFITWLLTLSDESRNSFYKAVSVLRKL